MANNKSLKDYHDLRKYMTSVAIASPALGAVANHIEIERLAEHWVVGAQANITLSDIERVSKHYGFNRDFAKRCFTQLKRNHHKLGANEIFSTLSQHLSDLDDDIIDFISEQLSFPHLYKHPSDKKGLRVLASMEEIIDAQNNRLDLKSTKTGPSDHLIVKDLCISYGKLLFSKKLNVNEWWRGFEKFAPFCCQTNAHLASFKECCLVLTDFIYKHGSNPSVEQKIVGLIIRDVFHYKAYVGQSQAECLMFVILTFSRKITGKTCSFLIDQLIHKWAHGTNVKNNSKRCEMIIWTLCMMIPSIAMNGLSDEQQQNALNAVSKLVMTVFNGWTAPKQEATRRWTALCYHQLLKYDLSTHSALKIDEVTVKKMTNLLNGTRGWDADQLTSEVFPIFDEEYVQNLDNENDGGNDDNKKHSKKKKKKKKKLNAKEKAQKRKKQMKAARTQQYKLYNNNDWAQMGQSMKSVQSIMQKFTDENEDIFENFQRMKTVEPMTNDPDIDFDENAFEQIAAEQNMAMNDPKEMEKEKLTKIANKKFFLMEEIAKKGNPYMDKIQKERDDFIPCIQWDAKMIIAWIKNEHFELGINDMIDDYFPDYLNGYLFLNFIRFPFEVCKENVRQSGMIWPDSFFNAMWSVCKEFHTKYLLECGISKIGECCGQINALQIESHRLSHILQENDIEYDPNYAKQCVTQELIAPKFEQLLAKEDEEYPRWTDADAMQLKKLYVTLASKLENETLDLLKNDSKYAEAMRKCQFDLRELSTRVEHRYNDLEYFNTALTTQQLMLRDLAVKSKHLNAEKNQLLNEYASAVNEKNYFLRELHINGKLPYIEHLEKLKAEIQRQVHDVTLLDYQKSAIIESEHRWIQLIDLLIDVFLKNEESEKKEFEQNLSRQLLDEHNMQKKKGRRHKKRSSRSNTPKHRKGASSMHQSKHRRNISMQSNKSLQRSDSSQTLSNELDASSKTRTVFNRETNIDIAYVLKKMFVHFVVNEDEKSDFLPDFDTMIDSFYDADSSQIHYVPVDVDTKRLKDYVMEGKAAKMAQIKEQKDKMKESNEQILAAKESMAQHLEEKPEHILQKEKEKEVKKQQRRDRHKAILEKKEDENDNKKSEEKNEEKKEENDVLVPPPPPPLPFYEKVDENDNAKLIVPPPKNENAVNAERQRERHRKSVVDAQSIYRAQWAQYQQRQNEVAIQYAKEYKEYAIKWQMASIGNLSQDEWLIIQRNFVLKWRAYTFWLQYQRYLQWIENTMYQMALTEFDQDECDLWLKWRRMQIDKISNLDKMQCLRVDSKVKAMYSAKYPNTQQQQPWNMNMNQQSNNMHSMAAMQQTQMMQQQMSQQMPYQQPQQPQQQNMAPPPPPPQEQQQQQMPASTMTLDNAPKMNNDEYVPSKGNQLLQTLEPDDIKRQRALKRLARKKRRGMQRLKPSTQQIRNDQNN